MQRIKIPEILEDEWFRKGYKPAIFTEEEDVNVDDVAAAFNDSKVLCLWQYFYPIFTYIVTIIWKCKKETVEAVLKLYICSLWYVGKFCDGDKREASVNECFWAHI